MATKNNLFLGSMADKDQLVSFDSKFYDYFKNTFAIRKASTFTSATGGNVNHFFLIKFNDLNFGN